MSSVPDCSGASSATDPESQIDLREALFNDGATGLASVIQIPRERITRLKGFMVDLDPDLLVPGNAIFPPARDPREFLKRIRPALDRHPVLRDAEIRATGRGLHAITWFDPSVELRTAADQQHWHHLVRIVQCSVPSDPKAPSITALTRPIGSVNGKTGRVVVQLRSGQPIRPDVVEAFARQIARAPFKTIANVLLGDERVTPCPICEEPGSSLGVGDHIGHCYHCKSKKIDLMRFYSTIYTPSDAAAVAAKPKTGKTTLNRGPKKRRSA